MRLRGRETDGFKSRHERGREKGAGGAGTGAEMRIKANP